MQALSAIKQCRTQASPKMLSRCTDTGCAHQKLVPHSCGHRHCPHCQHHESQQWLERQLKRQLPAEYFLLTFTVPAQFRALTAAAPALIYDLLLTCSWETVRTFARNDKQLRGESGAIAVLHTHTRRLDYHPHVHLVMPAGAIDQRTRQWRTKPKRKKAAGAYLFNHKALAKVFRAKLLAALEAAGLHLPPAYPADWVVDCKSVGNGQSALVYLGRYLYRGDPRAGHRRLCRWQGHFPLSRCPKRQDDAAHGERAGVSVACLAARLAQGLSTGAQFRLSASELQTLDRLAASVAQIHPDAGE